MSLDYSAVNWVAVVVAAAANLVVGFVWYRPQVFGDRWAMVIGRPLPQPGQVAPLTYLYAVILAVVTAYALAVIINGLGAIGIADGALVGFLVWLGFAATATYGSVLWEGRPPTWWSIVAGYWLAGLLIQGAILGYRA